MKDLSDNQYERAFENWLIDRQIDYIAIDEYKTAEFGHPEIKSFDFLLHLPGGQIIIAEVKGRSFKGTSLVNLTGFECWVTKEDVDGLSKWQQILGTGHKAVFIFVYRIENIDVDFDGREIFEFDSNRYVLFYIRLDDYRKYMKRRSPKWQTVTLPADIFRQYSIHINNLLD